MITAEEYLATEEHLAKSEINPYAHEFLVHLCVEYSKAYDRALLDVERANVGNRAMSEIHAYLINLGRK